MSLDPRDPNFPDDHPVLAVGIVAAFIGFALSVAIYVAAWTIEFFVHVLPWPAHPFGITSHVQAK